MAAEHATREVNAEFGHANISRTLVAVCQTAVHRASGFPQAVG
jgi:hypothetical protein